MNDLPPPRRPLPRLLTPRLLLRDWSDADLAPFAALNADPEVARHLPGTLTREASDAMAARIRAHLGRHGYGLFAVERRSEPGFLGFVGLSQVPFEAAFTPAVEIGWRLAREHWGQGYATEAAAAVVELAFGELDLDDLVSFTVPGNLASRRVMEKLGMRRDPGEDFDHPRLAEGHPLRRHVLYRLRRVTSPPRVP
jgi:RimJ/RimL family protein N-acetyltransferase